MCVTALAWDAHPDWLLVCAGNRDEFHDRLAAPLARWPDEPGLIAGRDLTGGGTWLGVSEAGRFAVVTNYRTPEGAQPGRPSRGKLVTDVLCGRESEPVATMNPFNLFLVDRGRVSLLTNYPAQEDRPLPPGLHGLSNGGFDAPWAKTRRLIAALDRWLASGTGDPATLLTTLRDETPPAPDAPADSPDAIPLFIRNAVYGTRCSTVVAVGRDGTGKIVERRFDAEGAVTGETAIGFRWEARG
ncbi:NRDE family protein [Novosphingobium colocasiae]|uniref:NRDE family protein n=1 Tax=Novosphingobium colocasiae TaxID=1256513 RepID=A0A918PFB5_9SPHN|nr:NRDE family protein [Novosphingobium colocasiae]GGZ02202.1 hypothetical protein GCM10011614_16500 [Novosphingobium colocasiae]